MSASNASYMALLVASSIGFVGSSLCRNASSKVVTDGKDIITAYPIG